jgi:Zn-dependent metalloprotease
MRKITLTIFSIFMVVALFGQTTKKKAKIKGDESQKPNLDFKVEILNKNINKSQANKGSFTLPQTLTFESLKETNFIIESTGDNNHVNWMTGFVDQSKSISWSAKAQGWLDAAYETLSLDAEKTSFDIVNEWTDEINQTHIKMNQLHDGIKVYAGEIILHGKKNRLFAQNGFYVPSKLINEAKYNVISKDEAITNVSSELKNIKEDWNVLNGLDLKIEKNQWETELVYYKNKDGRYDLMYYIEVYPNLAEHYTYFVDGKSGNIVDHFSTICKFHHSVKSDDHTECTHTHKHVVKEEPINFPMPPNGPITTTATDLLGSNRLINTYGFSNNFFLIDASRSMYSSSQSNIPDDPNGAIWTIDLNNTSPANNDAEYSHVVSNNNSFNNSQEGVSAHYNAGEAYEYYENTFNRQSISQSLQGRGQNILSFVNVADEFGASMGNAFWNGSGIFYGNGDSAFNSLGRALDVAGHEMSHGVIQNTANLEYRNESGALNESFADIFGAMIDRDDWKMGEDVVKTSTFPSGALRDLSDPHNGAATGDFGRGWQPRNFNERFTGSQDNGGVHINSGIPNFAYYLFATNNSVGKARAEQVYYRALTTYLTKSSGFAEMRSAVVKSAQDLYGADVVSAARSAFDQVGILGESDEDFQDDFDENPGSDYLLESDQNLSNLYVKTVPELNPFFDPISTTDLFSKPSITDDGAIIVFVGQDHHIHAIQIDWNANPPVAQEVIVSENPEWDNVAISKDGRFIAAIDMLVVPRIFVFDLVAGASKEFPLFNPTTSTDGQQTADVQYADVVEFDPTGTTIMYDAFNEISSDNSGSIGYYDIGFLNFWDNSANNWAEGGIEKLFGSLPSDTEVFNPAFAKNSPFIVAFDVREDFENSIYGVNLETQKLNQIFPNTGLGYPNYSKTDEVLIYDLELLGYTDIGGLVLNEDKISAVSNSDGIVDQGRKWGSFFSTGQRILSDVEEVVVADGTLILYPNPAKDILSINLYLENIQGSASIEVSDISGRKLIQKNQSIQDLKFYNLDISALTSGSYILSIRTSDKIVTQKFVKK